MPGDAVCFWICCEPEVDCLGDVADAGESFSPTESIIAGSPSVRKRNLSEGSSETRQWVPFYTLEKFPKIFMADSQTGNNSPGVRFYISGEIRIAFHESWPRQTTVTGEHTAGVGRVPTST
jgi:hypothetical protein